MLSPPTLSNTSGLSSPPAISVSRSPEAPPWPTNLYPSAVVNAGETIFSFRNCNDDAYATFTLPVGFADAEAFALALAELPPEEKDEPELQPAATTTRAATPATAANRTRNFVGRSAICLTLASLKLQRQ